MIIVEWTHPLIYLKFKRIPGDILNSWSLFPQSISPSRSSHTDGLVESAGPLTSSALMAELSALNPVGETKLMVFITPYKHHAPQCGSQIRINTVLPLLLFSIYIYQDGFFQLFYLIETHIKFYNSLTVRKK